jgi:hypothetical protein
MRTPIQQLLSSALGIFVVATCGMLSVAPSAATEVTADSPRVSEALTPTLRAAQKSLVAQNFADALAKLQQAAANPNRTPYDEHVIHVLAAAAYARSGNYLAAADAFEAQLNDGFLAGSEIPRVVKSVTQLNYQLKNYDKAVGFGLRALREGSSDDQVYTLVSQAYYLNGQFSAVRDFLKKRIDTLDRHGQEVPQHDLQLIVASCTRLRDSPCLGTYSPRLKGIGGAPLSPPPRRDPIDSPPPHDNSRSVADVPTVND